MRGRTFLSLALSTSVDNSPGGTGLKQGARSQVCREPRAPGAQGTRSPVPVSHMGGTNPVAWVTTTASHGLHWPEAGIGGWIWDSDMGLRLLSRCLDLEAKSLPRECHLKFQDYGFRISLTFHWLRESVMAKPDMVVPTHITPRAYAFLPGLLLNPVVSLCLPVSLDALGPFFKVFLEHMFHPFFTA